MAQFESLIMNVSRVEMQKRHLLLSATPRSKVLIFTTFDTILNFFHQSNQQLYWQQMDFQLFTFILIFCQNNQQLQTFHQQIIIKFSMDLPYPSLHDAQLSLELKQPSKRNHSVLIKQSTKQIPLPSLSSKNKTKILNYLKLDDISNLKQYIERQVIAFQHEVGEQGSKDTILHISVNHNAVRCTEYILKTKYKQFPQEYEQFINNSNTLRLTPIMISILNKANQCLEILLDYGGVDIHVIDGHKLTPYQLAVNSQNDYAIKKLLNYQKKSKKNKIINREVLSQPQYIEQHESWCQTLYNCLINCFTCGMFGEHQKYGNNQNKISNNHPILRLPSKKKISALLHLENMFYDHVDLGYQQSQLKGEICWCDFNQFLESKQPLLFDNFCPTDNFEPNYVIKNISIIFQSLSQHPWLIRRIIQIDKSKSNHYNVKFYFNQQTKCISINSQVPFLANQANSLFICNKKQGWPMLLLKGLAKLYGSYKNLESISPTEIMRVLTSWPTLQKPIVQLSSPISFLQDLAEEGYYFILQGRAGSYLSESNSSISYFTVINYHSKNDKKLVLVSCNFIDDVWQEKQKHQILALKIIKGYYNYDRSKQMMIWIEEDKMMEYFDSILISTALPRYQYSSMKINSPTNNFFFKYSVRSDEQQPILIYLFDYETNESIQANITIYKNQSEKINPISNKLCLQNMIHVPSSSGQFLCRIQFSKPIEKAQLTVHSIEVVTPQKIDEKLALFDWILCIRNDLIASWKYTETYIIQRIQDLALIITHQEKAERVYLSLPIATDEIYEGQSCSAGVINLIKDGLFFYCVVKHNSSINQINFYFE